MKNLVLWATMILTTVEIASAQHLEALASPPAETSIKIAGKTVSILYSSPSKRARKIFGGLVPYGQVWRAGANAATSLRTEVDLMIGTLAVPKGSYTLYVIPTEQEWTLIVNKQTGQSGDVYRESRDLGRTRMILKTISGSVESFKIFLEGNALIMVWDNAEATVPVVRN